MEKNNHQDELLIRYITDEVNAEEREIVETWIGTSETNRGYFERLKNAWQLTSVKQTLDYVLDELNVDEKWKRFERSVGAKEAKIISIEEKEQFEGADDEQRTGRKSRIKRLLIGTAIAASVLLVIVLGTKLFIQDQQGVSVGVDNSKKKDSLTFVVHHEVNTTGKEKRIKIADGSLIVLADKSEITYRQPFTTNREIVLSGKAYFKVAKDKTKPFIVVSGDISTMALGTEFTVTAFKNARQILVRLYEGKVVVKPVDKGNLKMKNDVYLLPGQELVYSDGAVKIRTFKLNHEAAPERIMNEELLNDDPSIPGNTRASYFMFNNQPLSQVFDNLTTLYGVKIVYDKKDIKDIYFTAKYNKSEPLEPILNRIGTLNNLSVIKKDTAFIISK